MMSAVKKIGNSAGIIIPKLLLREIGVEAGDQVDLRVEGRSIVIEVVPENPRAGWAEDARRIAAEEDVDLEWEGFPNDEDDKLAW